MEFTRCSNVYVTTLGEKDYYSKKKPFMMCEYKKSLEPIDSKKKKKSISWPSFWSSNANL